MCDSQELLVGSLYNELSPGERQTLQAHLAGCGECRVELEGLRATRTHLALWSPPVPDLGFRVILGGSAPALALPRRMRLAPAFAFAAAAVVVLAVAAAIANVEVRYDNDGLMVRTGWVASVPAATGAQANPAPNAGSAEPVATGDPFAVLERRLQEIEQALASQPVNGTQLATSTITRMSDAEMLGQVRRIVHEAEARQNTVVAERMLAVIADLQRQHRADFAVMQQGLGQYQGMTNAEMAQTRDRVNQLMRVANRQEK